MVQGFFVFLLLFSVFHVVRDISQNLHFENLTTAPFTMTANWCGWYCDWITYPFEILIFTGAAVTLKNNRVQLLGKVAVVLFFIWAGMFLYDFFVFS